MNDQNAGSLTGTQGVEIGSHPADHVRILHSRAWAGGAAVAQADGRWREELVPLADLSRHVADLGGQRDVYLSQARFFPRRRIARLVTVGSVWVDLDYYRTESLRGRRPGDVAGDVLLECADQGFLLPSYQVATGRGLLVVWLHEELPPVALPRWRLVQRALLERFAGYGADVSAADAAHVFRLWGSVSGRSGTAIAPVAGEASPLVHRFDDLADSILPHTRAEIAAMPERPRNRKGRELFTGEVGRDLDCPRESLGPAHGGPEGPPRASVVGGDAPPQPEGPLALRRERGALLDGVRGEDEAGGPRARPDRDRRRLERPADPHRHGHGDPEGRGRGEGGDRRVERTAGRSPLPDADPDDPVLVGDHPRGGERGRPPDARVPRAPERARSGRREGVRPGEGPEGCCGRSGGVAAAGRGTVDPGDRGRARSASLDGPSSPLSARREGVPRTCIGCGVAHSVLAA